MLALAAGFPVAAAGGAAAASAEVPSPEVFVASQGAGEVARIAPGAGAASGRRPVAAGPAAVACDAAGRLYLSHPDAHAVTVLEPDGPGAPRRLPYAGQGFGIAADPEGRFVFLGDWSGGRVSRLSTADGTVAGVAAVGREPANLVLDRKGRLFVADRESHQVSVVDAVRMERIAVVPTGQAPFALALNPAQDRLYVANVRSNDLTVIDTDALRVLATVPAGAMPYGVAVSDDGGLVLVSNQHAGTVSVLGADTLAIRATVKVGAYPEGVVALGPRAYVANWFSDDVSTIDLADLRETARIPVGEGPRALCRAPGPAAASGQQTPAPEGSHR